VEVQKTREVVLGMSIQGDKPVVAVTRGENVLDMVRKASAFIGFEKIVKPSDVVLVKPNFGGVRRGVYTSPGMVEAVVTLLKEDLGVGEVIIGDGTASGGPTWRVFIEHGLETKLAVKYKPSIRFVDFNYDEVVKVDIPNGYVLDELWVPRTVHEVADLIVSVPVLKTWPGSAVSLSLKNMFGVPPTRYYSWSAAKPSSASKVALHLENPDNPSEWVYGQSVKLAGVIVDICTVVKSDVSFVDGLTVYDETGVYDVNAVNAVIAGFDPVAVDAVSCLTMGFNPLKILHLNMAAEKGLGINAPEKIAVLGDSVEEIRYSCKPRKGMEEICVL